MQDHEICYIASLRDIFAGAGQQRKGLQEPVRFNSRDVLKQSRNKQMAVKILKMKKSFSMTFPAMEKKCLVACTV